MDSWYEITLPGGLDAAPATNDVLSIFRAASVGPQGKGAALYMDDGPQLKYYLSPKAVLLCPALISRFHGKPCDEPTKTHASVIADPDGVGFAE